MTNDRSGRRVRLLAITPIHVDGAELGRRLDRYRRLAPPGLEVELRDIGARAPRALDGAGDVRRSTGLMAEAVAAAEDEGFDAVLPDCVLDPAVPADAAAPGRVRGILRLCCGRLWGEGRRFGAVARNAAIAAELDRRVADYGCAEGYVGTEVLDLDVAAIADERRWNEALGAALDRLAGRGASAVINGCSAVDLDPGAAFGVDVVDPTALALAALAPLPASAVLPAAGARS
ncbi:Asp/Glu/hydantoin racemase [Spinactinospora alkalitolerans]|uniref:Asp/Glu/hydantoin racemase n=1 Tax=Spinactinospora alkalitolerans TaxID=687207 RepID=A0A852TPU1_9ACTN|nr:aspartate/glutamate racemase family protein [Spinactinospora alkalitolerans]NYE45978.1 Asp/Glu/hydantoin racemase [Spinactinospora alkalitolerans]